MLPLLLIAIAAAETDSGAPLAEPSVHEARPDAAPSDPDSGRDAPAGLAQGSFDFDHLLNDPGFLRWFSGAIRVEVEGEVVFSVSEGTDVGGEPLGQDSIFWLGSISKTLCSTAVLHLVEEGRLGLDDPIGAHLPGWSPSDASREGEACTVGRLLAHECGFPREALSLEMKVGRDPLRDASVRTAFLEEARHIELDFTPGSKSEYSNVGYNLAGLLVMAKDQGTYDEIIQRRLLGPLGLKRTGTEPARVDDFFNRVAPMNITIGSEALASTQWLGLPADAPSRVGAAGHAFSTPAELTRFFQALTAGEIIPSEVLVEMLRPRSTDESYGLGIGLRARDGIREYWHNGALEPHGFSAHVSTIPAWNTTVTVLVNRGVMAVSASTVARRIIDVMRGKAYRSPFPEDAEDIFSANLIGLVFVVMPGWMLLVMLWKGLRPIRGARLPWATSVMGYALGVILVRGALGLHGDGIDPVFLPAAIGLPAALLIWIRMRGAGHQPILGERRSPRQRLVVWGGAIVSTGLLPVIGWWFGAYGPQFTAFMAFSVWAATRGTRTQTVAPSPT